VNDDPAISRATSQEIGKAIIAPAPAATNIGTNVP
jgi:hypothetical protein